MREEAGISAQEAAALLSVDRSRISNIESGRFGISADRVRTLACHYVCQDAALIDALASMTGDRSRGWWEEYRGILPAGLLDLAELEHHAREIRTAQTVHMPGLLQTLDHARAVFVEVLPALPPAEVEHRVSHRIKRQAVLDRAVPPRYTAIVHEAALRMEFGGRAVQLRQLDHLLAVSEREGITVLVIPFSAGGFPGAGQSVLYTSGPVPQLDTVQLDTAHGPGFVDTAAQLGKYRKILDRMEGAALKADESRDFVHEIAHQL